MTRLEKVIEWVKEVRTAKNHAWIYDDEGNIIDNAIVGDILPLLDELKEYEINADNAWIDNFKRKAKEHFYTYNFNANVSNDFAVWYTEKDDVCIMVMNVHLYGDARNVFDTDFVLKFNSALEFFYLESLTQPIYIDDKYVADVSLLSETYNVFDIESDTEVGNFYEVEKDILLEELKNIE